MTNQEFTVDLPKYNRKSAWAWIISHMLRYPLFPIIGLLAAVINNFAYSSIQVYVGQAFDVISNPGWLDSDLKAVAIAVLIAGLVQGVLGLVRNGALTFIATRFERDGREELYVSLLGKSQSFHGRQRIGDIMARATNDIHFLNFMFNPGIMLILDSVMGLIMPLFLIGRINTRLLLVPLIFTTVLIVLVWDYNRRLGPVSTERRTQFSTMNAHLAEAVSGVEIIKANVQEEQESQEFATNARKFRDLFVKQGGIEARYWPLLVLRLAIAAGVFHSLYLWQQEVITLGEALAYMGLFNALGFPTNISIFTFNLVNLGVAGAIRILEMINAETELDENSEGLSREVQGEVVFENVSFAYQGKPVIKDISFHVKPGETVAIVGQTGSGKTTLTRLINRIFDATEGRVLVDGEDVRDWSLESLRSQISVIEQDVFLFSRTLAGNIAFGCGAPEQDDAFSCAGVEREAIIEAAKEAQAHEFIMSFEEGYETEVGERGVTLSGGQRQRIAIARAFLTDPKVLILDDSTSAIDSATEDKIQRAMKRISEKRTTFIITHRLSQIRWADRILVLRRGELVDQGTHEDLMARSEAYRKIFTRYE